ncbi:MAG TPA: hypothetical protein VG102_01835 [Candidatus Paceibacterota bacterium]|jgi:hypothetical protein|nr:hypothetical protein [Candidatus Paceibacterota bacterium]
MTLDTVIMAFGAFVAVLPFLQFPQDWTNFFAFLAGVIIVGLGIAVRRRGLGHNSASDQAKLFDNGSEQ